MNSQNVFYDLYAYWQIVSKIQWKLPKEVSKRSFNILLNEIGSLPVGSALGSEPELA